MAAKLVRTVLGRQAAYARYSDLTGGNRGLDVFDTQDWDANNGTLTLDTTVTELRGSLRLTLPSSGSFSAYAIEAGVTNVLDTYLQMVTADIDTSSNPTSYTPTTGDIRGGLVMRGAAVVANTLPTDNIAVIAPGPNSTNSSPSNRAEISVREANVLTQTIRTAGDARQIFPSRIHAVLSGTTLAANNAGGSPSWSLSATGLTLPAGRVGFIAYNTFASGRYLFVAGYYRCRSKNLTVNGPVDSTWYVQLLDKDNNVLHTSSAQSGGQVIVDYETAALLLPLTQKIRITDGVSPLVTVYPDNGVWAGDTWTYTDDTTPSGIVTRTAAGLVMARLSSYLTTGLTISAQSLSDWTAWSNSGATNMGLTLETAAGISYPNDFRLTTSLIPTNFLRRGARWTGAEVIPSDAFMVATARIGTTGVAASTANGVWLRSGTAPQTARAGGVVAGTGTTPQEHLAEEMAASVVVQTSVVAGAAQVNRRNRFGLWVRGTTATFRAVLFREVSGSPIVSRTLTGLTSPPPTAGMALNMGANSSAYASVWQGMAVMTSAEITMSGPTSNVAVWGLRVRDASGMVVAESGANVAGVATLDTQAIMETAYGRYSISVMRSIEAYDTATGDTLSDVITPSGGIWGGDTFTVTNLPSSGGFPESRLAHRKAGAARLLFKR